MKKQLLLLFLALLPLVASAYDADIDGIYYNFSGDEATVTYQNSGTYTSDYSGEIVIPQTVVYKGKTYSVTSIGEWAFYSCSALTSITIPNSVTKIENYAFNYSTGLSSITIPSSVTDLGVYAVINCSRLASIVVESGNVKYDSRNNCNAIIETATNTLIAGCMNTVIPGSVTSINNGAFQKCTNLTSITIPNSVKSIGLLSFSNCTSLTSVDIPSSVTSIGSSAFSGCTSLSSVTISGSATNISERAFQDCIGITDVFCYTEEVPTTGSDVFMNSSIASATLHVPASTIELYKNAEPWNQFKTVVAITPQCQKPVIVYKVGSLQFRCETEGVKYVYSIASSGESTNGTISLNTTFTVSVYATREGYKNSETVTKTIDMAQVGDVNGDGLISIADVTTLVNLILGRN